MLGKDTFMNLMITLLLFLSSIRNAASADWELRYSDLQGAKRYNQAANLWEVAHSGSNVSEMRQVENVWYLEYDGKNITGKSFLSLKDMSLPGGGIKCPRLNITADMAVIENARGDYKIKYYSDRGRRVCERWRFKAFVARKTKADRFETSTAYLNSTELDEDRDGLWKADILREINTYRLPASLESLIIIPATYFDVPVPVKDKKNNVLEFSYLSEKGRKKFSVWLDGDYLSENRTCRIGFMRGSRIWHKYFRHKSLYVVQAGPDSGRIIGKIADADSLDKVNIIPGSLKIVSMGGGKEKRKEDKIVYGQQFGLNRICSNREEFWWYEVSRFYNCAEWRMSGIGNPEDFVWPDVYIKEREKRVLSSLQKSIDTAHKYGVKLSLNFPVGDMKAASLLLHPEYRGERLDPETGRFVPARLYDIGNQDAIEYSLKVNREYFKKLRGPIYIDLTEQAVGNKVAYEVPLYGKGTLRDYRGYLDDPGARFPTDGSIPETDRTFNDPSRKDWLDYYRWRQKIWTDHRFIDLWKAGYEALGSDPLYEGGSWTEGVFGLKTAVDLEKVVSSPYLSLIIFEQPPGQPLTSKCIDYARRYNKNIILLFRLWREPRQGDEKFGKFMARERAGARIISIWPYELIEQFLSVAVTPDVDGVAVHPPGWLPKSRMLGKTWLALLRKHYGMGEMSIEEAERIIDFIKQHPDTPPDEP